MAGTGAPLSAANSGLKTGLKPWDHLGFWLGLVALLTLGLRSWIALRFPLSGDEALFYAWGRDLAAGYYDHPPMAGWWLAASMALFGDELWALRLPAILLPLAIGGTLYGALAGLDRQRAQWAVLFYWLTPLSWLNCIMTTDTPLVLFAVLSFALLLWAEQPARPRVFSVAAYALSGLLLGAAFLSKYFAVLLGVAYLLYFAIYRRERWWGLALVVLFALWGPALNIWWNLHHCWSNIMFNLYNRNQGDGFAWSKPLSYLALWAYLLTPVGLWMVWRHRSALWRLPNAASWHGLLRCLVLVPVALFAMLAFKKLIGLHWVLAFYPLVFVWLAWGLPQSQLKKTAVGIGLFGAVHALVVGGLMFTQLADWRRLPLYPEIVRSYRTEAVVQQALSTPVQIPAGQALPAALSEPPLLMATGYTPAAIYGYTLKKYVPTFGMGSFHARQDDLQVDFSRFQGKTIRVLNTAPFDLKGVQAYFDAVYPFQFEQDGVIFYGFEGRGFRFEPYRQKILLPIAQQYYRIPSWLPMQACDFCQRYCGALRCSPA